MEIKNDEDAINAIMKTGMIGLADYVSSRLYWAENIQRPGRTFHSYSHEEMLTNAKKWMEANYPKDDRDEWLMRYGLLIDFVTDYFPQTNAQCSRTRS